MDNCYIFCNEMKYINLQNIFNVKPHGLDLEPVPLDLVVVQALLQYLVVIVLGQLVFVQVLVVIHNSY